MASELVGRKAWPILGHPARTAVAAVASLLAARLFQLPETYWAPITTIVTTQSSLGAALTVSWQRFVGTAFGAAVGALVASHFGPHALVFGASVFALGLLCAVTNADRSAYRFGGIALAIVLLVPRTRSPDDLDGVGGNRERLSGDCCRDRAAYRRLYITSAIAQPTMGRLADRLGARRVFLAGLYLVALAGVAGTFAPSLRALIWVRVLLGVGLEHDPLVNFRKLEASRPGFHYRGTENLEVLVHGRRESREQGKR